jgi:hypothetical protein
MILPSKIVKPVDSLIYISSEILKTLDSRSLTCDEILNDINKDVLKNVDLNKILLGLNFLYLIDKIERENEIIRIKV